MVLAGLAGIAAVAWLYLFYLGATMMPATGGFDGGALAGLFVMWAVMMAAMMLPGAAPMVVVFDAVGRERRAEGEEGAPTWPFVLGYVLAWTAFALAAAVLQWALHRAALLSPMMESVSPVTGGLLFIAAGLYQWTPLKRVCLKHCRSPLTFILLHWREGEVGALRMGFRHGVYCLGCCWVLMALLFAVGVMNLWWVGAIAAFVVVEKIAPGGEALARTGGALMLAAGLTLLATAPWY